MTHINNYKTNVCELIHFQRQLTVSSCIKITSSQVILHDWIHRWEQTEKDQWPCDYTSLYLTTTFPFRKLHNRLENWMSKKKKSLLMKFTGSPWHSTCFPWWRNTLWWEGEIMRTRMPERYNIIGMGIFNQNTLLFNFHSCRLTSPVISFDWHRSVVAGAADYFPLIREWWSVCISMNMISQITSLTSESHFMFGQDVTGEELHAVILMGVSLSARDDVTHYTSSADHFLSFIAAKIHSFTWTDLKSSAVLSAASDESVEPHLVTSNSHCEHRMPSNTATMQPRPQI